MKQKYMFLAEEGDRWFERNAAKLADYSIDLDPVVKAMRTAGLRPKRVLEIGCGDGRRLAALRDAYGCEIMGVEPSMRAAGDAASRRVPVVQASASSPPISGTFDLVIYGYCLYLTDPDDWLLIAAEGDKLLKVGGHLVVHDFAIESEPFERSAFARHYEHRDGVLAYHFDFAMLWLIHPLYYQIHRMKYDDQMVTILRKSPERIEVRP